MSARDLLIEIGTEELPPKALSGLSRAFADLVCKQLDEKSLTFGSCERFATPRRLALLFQDLQEAQRDREQTRFGPAVKAAFNEGGEPTPAALGFAKSCGVEVSALQRQEKDGVEKLSYTVQEKGQPTAELLPAIVNRALSQLPIPKRMRWGSSRTEFVRPVHWAVMLFGEKVIECDILGVSTTGETRGHRFHHNQNIKLAAPADYESVLESIGVVIPRFDKRKEKIRELVLIEAEACQARAVIDEALLDEVTSLVEFPVALTGNFEPEFLEVPQEALILAMKSHQKCFYLVDESEKLLPRFITISNIQSKDPAQVIQGNERVIRPRLADARFFFDTDRQQTLASRYESLGSLVFQDKLGTVKDKCDRVASLSAMLASRLSENEDYCRRAAQLSKCDLLTQMVGEFADLQGLMGYYYALNDGEPEEVARAINEQYQPRYAGDAVPETATGAILAIADKLDSMIGMFGIGQPPTGSKDPFALRRSAIGVLRIMIEKNLVLDLRDCISDSLATYSQVKLENNLEEVVFEFFLDRFRSWYLDEGITSEEFQAVHALRPSRPLDFHHRIQAVHHFNTLPEAAALAAANKRVSNILDKQQLESESLAVQEKLLTDEAEKALYTAMKDKAREVVPLFETGSYTQGLQSLASLKEVIDPFFDQVLVMAEDDEIRSNRLALLQNLQSLFLRAADISQLHKS